VAAWRPLRGHITLTVTVAVFSEARIWFTLVLSAEIAGTPEASPNTLRRITLAGPTELGYQRGNPPC